MPTELERLVVQLEAQTVKFDKALAKAEGRMSTSAKRLERTAAQASKRIGAELSGLGGKALGVLGVGLGTQQVIGYADSWTRATNALKVAGLSGAALTGTMDALYAAAQRQGAPLEAMTTLYGRLTQSQQELGATNQELIRFSEDVAIALRAAGTSPEQATGALLQLSQALGSARVQAEEFNSINEGARPILQAVANGLVEAGGSVSKLKQLVNDGSVSNTLFFKAFQAGIHTIRDQAAEAEPTISGAFTRVQNAITRLVGEVDKSAGFSSSFIGEINNMAESFDNAVGPVNELIEYLQKLSDLYEYLSESGPNLGKKLNQALFGVDTVGEFMFPEPESGSGHIGPTTRNTRRSQSPPPVSTKDYPVIGGKSPKGGGSGSRSRDSRPDDYVRETKQIHERIAAMELEIETMGKATYEVEKAKVQHELLNAARDAGKAITPELRAEIEKEADAYAQMAVKLEQAKQAYEVLQEVQDGLASSFSGVASAIAKGEDAVEALTQSLSRLMDQLIDMIAKQLFKQLFAGLDMSGFGFSGGGAVGGKSIGLYASGGKISGPGSGTSDSIPAMLSNGEFVVRASQAKKYGALLEAINSNRLRLPAFATGGSVGAPVARGGGFDGDMIVNIQNNGAQVETRQRQQGNSRILDVLVEQKLNQAIVGGRMDRSMRTRFGNMPVPVRRG